MFIYWLHAVCMFICLTLIKLSILTNGANSIQHALSLNLATHWQTWSFYFISKCIVSFHQLLSSQFIFSYSLFLSSHVYRFLSLIAILPRVSFPISCCYFTTCIVFLSLVALFPHVSLPLVLLSSNMNRFLSPVDIFQLVSIAWMHSSRIIYFNCTAAGHQHHLQELHISSSIYIDVTAATSFT